MWWPLPVILAFRGQSQESQANHSYKGRPWFGGGWFGLVWRFVFVFVLYVLLFVVLRGIDKAEVQASMEMTVTPSSWPVPQWVLQSFPCLKTLSLHRLSIPYPNTEDQKC